MKDRVWISTKERLPRIGENVILCSCEGVVGEGIRIKNDNWGWLMFRWSMRFMDDQITHWAKLPKGYKKGDEK